MNFAKAFLLNGETADLKITITESENGAVLTVKKEDVPENTDYIDVTYMALAGKEGDSGYVVLPNNHIYYFKNHEDEVYQLKRNRMPVFGVKNDTKSFVAIVKSMNYDYHTMAVRKDGKYYVYPRFILDGDDMYEDIIIDYTYLDNNCTYNEMAEVYRNYILDNKICRPLKERAEEREELKYAITAPLVRIRNGWKPCPATVMEQTLENEPPMHVACDFDRVGDIVDEFKKQGVKSAEISLVGWNIRGHDGRWPDILPADYELGGNEKLKEVIKKAQDNGYNMTCHTNSTDAYSIASTWNEDDIMRNKDMSISKSDMGWSGGQMYNICPKPAYELAEKLLPSVRELGFKGIHYIDVMSSVQPRKCYHKNHALTKKDVISYYKKIADLSTQLFGGFSSEGPADYACPFMDYVLYAGCGDAATNLKDKSVPFWQLVYHGIILYNPLSDTMNYTIKSDEMKLKFVEYGGRPSFYFHSRFVDESSGIKNWMGLNDLTTGDKMVESVAKIKEGCDEYEKLSYLQTEFMIRHEEISDNVFCVTYSDGSKIVVDYNKNKYELIKG